MNSNYKYITVFAVAIGALILLALFMPQEEDNSLGGRINRAVEKASEGRADAGKELNPESQKTAGEKIGDAVEDADKSIKGTPH